MPKLKDGVVDSTKFFNIDGIDYPMSDYTIFYDQVETDSAGNVDETKIRVGIKNKNSENRSLLIVPSLVAQWRDSTDSTYLTLAALLTDLTLFLGLSSGGDGLSSLASPLPVVNESDSHRAIHAGRCYNMQHRVVIGRRSVEDLFLKLGGTKYPHILSLIITADGGEVDIDFFEGTTVSADGTQLLEPVDRNRNFKSTPDMIFYANPTITDDGENISFLWIPTVNAGQSVTKSLAEYEGDVWILEQATNYLMRLTNNSTQDLEIHVDITWMEETEFTL